jgi:hypothetical protein
MSTVYTDAADNRYLGDCRWGNHDINYPTTNYLLAVKQFNYYYEWRDGVKDLLTAAGYTSMTWDTSTGNYAPGGQIFQVTLPAGGYIRFLGNGTTSSIGVNFNGLLNSISIANPFYTNNSGLPGDYSICCSNNSLSMMFWSNRVYAPYGENRTIYCSYPSFIYCGVLQDVNTNFSYYTPYNNKIIQLYIRANNNPPVTQNASTLSVNEQSNLHYIANASKNLLTTGRAAYSIACSDGQTPGAQWATDMWVYDNNATLGYPVIGRVPNMLLGTGTYTYLKPVKIQGSVFPDGGSPWYLPVGQFAGKVLLMRCYSSMS